MKKITHLFLFSILITACAGATSAPSPTPPASVETVAVPTAIPATETPTVVPTSTEPAEQKASRELAEAVAAGMHSNDPETWTGQYAQYTEWLKNASNPELVPDAQLNELNVFMQSLRKADQLYYFSQNPENAKIILTDFLVQFVQGSITREVAAAMTVEDLETLAYSQNEYQRQFLELRYRAMTQEEAILSPTEMMYAETDPNGKIIYHEEWDHGQPAGVGFYGMWVNNSRLYSKYPDSTVAHVPYTIPMFGRNVIRTGALLGDAMVADLAGYGKSRDGLYYTYWIMKDTSGKIYLHIYLVVTDANNPIDLPEGNICLGASNATGTVDQPCQALKLTTLFAVDKDAFNEFRTQLTGDVLKSWLQWPPYVAKIFSGGVALPVIGYASQFFDPETGLMIIGSEVEGLKQGYIFFGTDLHNPWP